MIIGVPRESSSCVASTVDAHTGSSSRVASEVDVDTESSSCVASAVDGPQSSTCIASTVDVNIARECSTAADEELATCVRSKREFESNVSSTCRKNRSDRVCDVRVLVRSEKHQRNLIFCFNTEPYLTMPHTAQVTRVKFNTTHAQRIDTYHLRVCLQN